MNLLGPLGKPYCFHLVWGSSQRSAVEKALVELRASIILAVKAPDREILRNHVADLLAGFQSQLDCESYCEDAFMRTERLKRLASGSEFDLERSSAIEDFTLPVLSDRDRLLTLISPALESQAESAFWLGYVLDQGVRPPSVCDHLLAPAERSTESPAVAWVPSAQPDEGRELPLADRFVEPGMIHPQPGWNVEVVARWVATFGREPESGVRAAIDVLPDADLAARRLAISVVDSAVLSTAKSLQNARSPTQRPRRRKSNRNDERDNYIYEQARGGIAYKSILSAVRQHSDWRKVSSVQALRQAAIRYAKRHKKPEPEKRR